MYSILSWNVNGIRTGVIPVLENFIDKIDFICLQETKLTEKTFTEIRLDGYHGLFSISKNPKKGRSAYAGVAIFIKNSFKDKIISVNHNFLEDQHIDDGRFLSVEFEDFVIATVYVPNSGTNQEFREIIWHHQIKKWALNVNKKLILTGDFNSITTPHDVWWAKPPESMNSRLISEKAFHEKVMRDHEDSPGVMPYEIDALKDLIESVHLTDNWKYHHLNETYSGFTWFNPRSLGARSQNKGWRIDYIFTNFVPKPGSKCETIDVDRKASDHNPLFAIL